MEGRGIKQNAEKNKTYFNRAMAKGHPWVEHIIEIMEPTTLFTTA
jgi:hypothetical protein